MQILQASTFVPFYFSSMRFEFKSASGLYSNRRCWSISVKIYFLFRKATYLTSTLFFFAFCIKWYSSIFECVFVFVVFGVVSVGGGGCSSQAHPPALPDNPLFGRPIGVVKSCLVWFLFSVIAWLGLAIKTNQLNKMLICHYSFCYFCYYLNGVFLCTTKKLNGVFYLDPFLCFVLSFKIGTVQLYSH